MALVSYDVSDASDEEDDASDAQQVELEISTKTVDTTTNPVSSSEEPEGLFRSALPTPKAKPLVFNSDLSERLLLNKSKYSSNKKSVKITVPSLSEFDEDLPTPTTKKIAQSAKGSGLFALLPPPKNSAAQATENKLVPDSLRKRPQPKPVPKLPTKILPKPVIAPAPPIAEETIDEEDDMEDTSDFLGLNSKHEPDPQSPDIILLDMPVSQPQNVVGKVQEDEVVEVTEQQNRIDNSCYPPSGDFVPIPSEDLELDDEALQKLCGGNKRRRANIPTNVIDVSEKDVVPDHSEWMVKHLSEEKVVKTNSHKKNAGPSSQQKRKHQITYLAFQAKEQEMELQNQWAQNRMTKKQTQSKYGF